MKKSVFILTIVLAVFLSISVEATEGELFYSIGGMSYHHQKMEVMDFNEVHPGIGMEYTNVIPFFSSQKVRYSILGHYMAKDSFKKSAFWAGIAGF
jgi:hypothetical protein